MTTLTVDGDLETIGAGHQGTTSGHDHAVGQVAEDVNGEGPVDAVEYALVDHVPGAVKTLFTWLEHEPDATVELRGLLDEQARRADQHRHVRIVTARVHATVVA